MHLFHKILDSVVEDGSVIGKGVKMVYWFEMMNSILFVIFMCEMVIS